jgi:transcriptional regulator of acetoin/glycerol metabolism
MEPGPLGSWGYDPATWEAPERLTLLVLASQLFADQRERIRFFDEVTRSGRARWERVTLRRADGTPAAAAAEAVVHREGAGYRLSLTLDTAAGSADSSGEIASAIARVRSRALEQLGVPETGRTAERLARFFDWIVPRTGPLLILGSHGARASALAESVHEARGGGADFLRFDAELETPENLAARLALSFPQAPAPGAERTAGLLVRRIDFLGEAAVGPIVDCLSGVTAGRRRGPLLYLTALPGAPIASRIASIGGVDVFILPALRDRPHEIVTVLGRMLRKPRAGQRLILTIDPAAARLIQAYDWPGNVDELHEVADAVRLISGGAELRVADLPLGFVERIEGRRAVPGATEGPRIPSARHGRRGRPPKRLTAAQIRSALEAADGNRAKAAEQLSVSRTTLWRKIAELGERVFETETPDGEKGGRGPRGPRDGGESA